MNERLETLSKRLFSSVRDREAYRAGEWELDDKELLSWFTDNRSLIIELLSLDPYLLASHNNSDSYDAYENTIWMHIKSKEVYKVLMIVNDDSESDNYPVTVIYERLSDKTRWSKPLSKWNDSMIKQQILFSS